MSMQRQRGFTLIELLVVIAIIGILATLVVTQLGGARVKARNSQAKSDATEAGKAIEVFKNDDRASDRIVGVGGTAAAADGSVGGADGLAISETVNSAGYAPFTGATNIDVDGAAPLASSYGLKLSKSAGAGYTYRYTTTNPAPSTDENLVNGGYVFCANTRAGAGENAGIFQIIDGSSSIVATDLGC